MPPTLREAPRVQLPKTIWRIADDLPGLLDMRDPKAYVPGMLIHHLNSESLDTFVTKSELEPDLEYAKLSDNWWWVRTGGASGVEDP